MCAPELRSVGERPGRPHLPERIAHAAGEDLVALDRVPDAGDGTVAIGLRLGVESPARFQVIPEAQVATHPGELAEPREAALVERPGVASGRVFDAEDDHILRDSDV